MHLLRLCVTDVQVNERFYRQVTCLARALLPRVQSRACLPNLKHELYNHQKLTQTDTSHAAQLSVLSRTSKYSYKTFSVCETHQHFGWTPDILKPQYATISPSNVLATTITADTMSRVGQIDPKTPQWNHQRLESFMSSAMSRLGSSDSKYVVFENNNQRIDAIRACLTGKHWTDSGTTYDDHFDQPESESLHELMPEGLLRALATEHSARYHRKAVAFEGNLEKAKAAAAQVSAVRRQRRAQRLAAEGPLKVANRKLTAARRNATRFGEIALVASDSDFYAHKRARKASARVELRAARVKALVEQERSSGNDLKKEASPMELGDDHEDEGGVSLLGHESLSSEKRVGWSSSLPLR